MNKSYADTLQQNCCTELFSGNELAYPKEIVGMKLIVSSSNYILKLTYVLCIHNSKNPLPILKWMKL
jgi:hypothetical protein